MSKSNIEKPESVYIEQRVNELRSSIKDFLDSMALQIIPEIDKKGMRIILMLDESLEVNEVIQLEDAFDYEEEEWDEILKDIFEDYPHFLNDQQIRIRIKLVDLEEERAEQIPEEIKDLVKEIVSKKNKFLN